jgi:hypothetical protein
MKMSNRFRSKRRVLLGAGLAAAGGAICARAAAQQKKVAKDQAKYQDQPKGDQRCDGCVQFEAPAGCKIVEGKISPSGWCILYGPKPK